MITKSGKAHSGRVAAEIAAYAAGPLVSPCEPKPISALGEFFSELATHLSLEAIPGSPLSTEQPFSGPGGLICRIETQRAGKAFVARPQLLLPLDDREIRSLEMRTLLSMQVALLSQLGWMLCHSAEGLLQLSPLRWTAEAREVARELEMGSTVGRMMMAMLQDGTDDHAARVLQ
jgi:hypothetical protein